MVRWGGPRAGWVAAGVVGGPCLWGGAAYGMLAHAGTPPPLAAALAVSFAAATAACLAGVWLYGNLLWHTGRWAVKAAPYTHTHGSVAACWHRTRAYGYATTAGAATAVVVAALTVWGWQGNITQYGAYTSSVVLVAPCLGLGAVGAVWAVLADTAASSGYTLGVPTARTVQAGVVGAAAAVATVVVMAGIPRWAMPLFLLLWLCVVVRHKALADGHARMWDTVGSTTHHN